jgi:hypothetical protein
MVNIIYFLSRNTEKPTKAVWLSIHAITFIPFLPWLIPFLSRISETSTISASTSFSLKSFTFALIARVVYAVYAFMFGHTVEIWHFILVTISTCAFSFAFIRGSIRIMLLNQDRFARLLLISFVGNFALSALVLTLFLRNLNFVFLSERVLFLVPFFLFIIIKGVQKLHRIVFFILAIIIISSSFSMFNLLTARENIIWSYRIPWKEIRQSVRTSNKTKQIILFDNYHLGSTGLYYFRNFENFQEIWDEQHEKVVIKIGNEVNRFQQACLIRSSRDITEEQTLQKLEATLKTSYIHWTEKKFVQDSPSLYKLKNRLRNRTEKTYKYKVRVLIFSNTAEINS